MPDLQNIETEIALRQHCIEHSVNCMKFHDDHYAQSLASVQKHSERLRKLEFQRYLHTPCYRYKVNG